MYFVVAYAYSGLSPVRARPWRANRKHPRENGAACENRRSDPAAVHMDLLFADIPDLINDGIHNFLPFVNRLLKHRL